MTPKELSLATGARIDRATEWLSAIEAAMIEFNIDTPQRKAMFLAQIGHESGGLHYTVELWGPTDAQRRYEGRIDLGNVVTGDGFKFRGRGLIQITGRANYREVADALQQPLTDSPEMLGKSPLAARSAGWWWKKHGLNEIADTGNLEKATRRINGGINGLADRQALYEAAQAVFV